MKEPRICIAVPSASGLVSIAWANQLLNIIPPAPIFMSYTHRIQSDDARSILVDLARDKEASHILFLDSDTMMPQDGLMKLYAQDRPFISGMYAMRNSGEPAVFIHDTERGGFGTLKKEAFEGEDHLISGDQLAVGMGCALVKMEVFDALTKPYFRFPWREGSGHDGEDIAFCERLRKAGIPIVVHSGVKCVHLDDSIVTWNGERHHLHAKDVHGRLQPTATPVVEAEGVAEHGPGRKGRRIDLRRSLSKKLET